MKDKEIGKRFVPIIPDEARTFGLDAIFPTAKIYSPHGQEYEAVDRELLLSYKESTTGQILHEGISEAGSMASLIAAGTSYATHAEPMIPFYIFYSMFGFQRTGDQFWQFADQLGRGFVLGATAGRTTLTGEGLQHADGHSLLLASTNPAAVAYDPAFAFEIAHIVRDGLRRMYAGGPNGTGEDVFYYLTIYNEPIVQPAEPENVDVEGILRGMHLYSPALGVDGRPRAQVLASGVAMPWALRAQRLLGEEWNVDADVWSVTSWNELRRDAVELRGGQPARSVGHSSSAVRDGPARRYLGTGGRGVGLHAGGAGPDLPLGADRLHLAGHGRFRFRRHPRRGPALLPRRRRVDRGGRAYRSRQARRGQARGAARGDRAVPAARCDRRRGRHRRRRRLTFARRELRVGVLERAPATTRTSLYPAPCVSAVSMNVTPRSRARRIVSISVPPVGLAVAPTHLHAGGGT